MGITNYQFNRAKVIVLEQLVSDMLPFIPTDSQNTFNLRFHGVDNAARQLYDRGKVNKPDNETKSAALVPIDPPAQQGEGLSMPDEEE